MTTSLQGYPRFGHGDQFLDSLGRKDENLAGAMRVYLGVSCDFTVMDGTSTAVAGQQTDAVDLYVAGSDFLGGTRDTCSPGRPSSSEHECSDGFVRLNTQSGKEA